MLLYTRRDIQNNDWVELHICNQVVYRVEKLENS